jgi:hypothetical protein
LDTPIVLDQIVIALVGSPIRNLEASSPANIQESLLSELKGFISFKTGALSQHSPDGLAKNVF